MRGRVVAPRSVSPSPCLASAPGSPGLTRRAPAVPWRAGPGSCSCPGANQRPEEARPVSRTPRCSLVSSQLVVKATGALKISFKEPPSGGARGVVMTTRPQVPAESFLPLPPSSRLWGEVGWRAGGDPCGPAGGLTASPLGLPPSLGLSLLLGSPTQRAHASLRTNPLNHQSTVFLLPFCKREVSGKQKCKIATVTLQPRDTCYLGLRR